jgi:hypothetical protein
MGTEDDRAGRLLDAQANAVALFDEVVARGIITAGRGEQAGWSMGGTHAGHLVGEFPHETIDGARIESYIAPGNTTPMRRPDKAGRVCHWILEIHLTDTARGFGGFYEQLLDLG